MAGTGAHGFCSVRASTTRGTSATPSGSSGFPCATIFGDTPKAERDRIIAAFKRDEVRALASMGVLTTGFNAPAVDLIAMLRPTKSTGLYVQMAGRGTRLAPGKENCLVLDFAGNVARHGPIDLVKPKDKANGEGNGGCVQPSAIRPQPVLAIGASLCALGALMGRKYRTQTNLRTNLYVVGMAGSGGGKDHARGAIKEAFIAAGLQRYLGGNRIASGSGPAHRALPPALQPVPARRVRAVPRQHRQQAPCAQVPRRDLGPADRAQHQRRRHLLRRRVRRPAAAAAPGHRPALLLRARHHRAGAVLGGAAGGLDGRRQPRPVPGVPDRRRCARPQPAAEADRRRAGRAGARRCRRSSPACRGTRRGNIAALVEGPMIVPDPYPVPMAPEAEQLFDAARRGADRAAA